MKTKKHVISCILILVGVLLSISGSVALEKDALVYVIDIRTEIGNGLRVYIERGINEAEQANADAIIFDVDTPGGRVDSAVKIIDAIQRVNIPTIAYVNRQAISAGAMISLSCDQIVMASGGTIGDSAPVSMGGDGVKEIESEKVLTYIRGTIRSTAERQGRNPDIAVVMVDKKLVLVKLANDEIVAFRPDEYTERKDAGEEMDVIVAEGELLTLTTDEALQYGFVDAQAEILKDLLGMYQIVRIDETLKALTKEAVMQKQTELGATRVKIITSLENATIEEVTVTLADRIVFFITSPMISSLLLSLGVLGIFIEIRTPGFGVPGILGLLCIGLFFGGHTLNQIEAEYAALFFVLGVAFMLLEIFVIPGFGIAGIAGITLMIGSVFYVFGTAYELETAIFWLSSSVLSTFAFAIFAAYLLPKTRTWQNFVLATELDSAYQSTTAESESYLGQTGTALTPLRPAGTARIGNKRLDVLTVGDFIARETPIKVVDVEGTKILVEAVDAT